MASAIQQPTVVRKLVYFALIVLLFSVITFAGSFARVLAGGVPPAWTISHQAAALDMTELGKGRAELTGSAVRLTLTGSRGLALTALWYAREEKKKKHEWGEVEVITRSISKLQPHFTTPWLFQSWDLAYNVSVESDQVKDKYFYISRGIELLAEGVSLNDNNPDMRFWLGFYYLNKFGVSDEANYLRSLFQMSCIDPRERDPKAFYKDDGRTFDLDRFREFCVKHPQLVRRLRDFLRRERPEQVVDFLAENRNIPSRFEDQPGSATAIKKASELKENPRERFPVLPVSFGFGNRDYREDEPERLGDAFDNYMAAQAWMAYAQLPLPPPDPSPVGLPKNPDPKKYRLPRAPMAVIFRQYPARCQAYVAERLLREGWFDAEGWVIEDRRSRSNGWFDEPLAVGTNRNWAVDAWTEAHRMYAEFGEQNGLYLSPEQKVNLETTAGLYRRTYNLTESEVGPELREAQAAPEMWKSFQAHAQLRSYNTNRQVTNFAHFYYRTQAEMSPDTVRARKLLFNAERLRKEAVTDLAIEKYQQGFEQWKQLLTKFAEFRADSSIQEEIYEKELRYLDLLREHRGPSMRLAVSTWMAADWAAGPNPVFPSPALLNLYYPDYSALLVGGKIKGPLDGTDPQGKPWIVESAVKQVEQRQTGRQPAAKPPEPAKTTTSPQ